MSTSRNLFKFICITAKKTKQNIKTPIASVSRKRKVHEITTSTLDILKSSVPKKLKATLATPAALKTPLSRKRRANEEKTSTFDTLKSSVPKKMRPNEPKMSMMNKPKPSVSNKNRKNKTKASKTPVPQKLRVNVAKMNVLKQSVPQKHRKNKASSIDMLKTNVTKIDAKTPKNQQNKRTGVFGTPVTFPGKRTANKSNTANRKEKKLASKKNKRVCAKSKSAKRKEKNDGWISSPFEPKLFDFDDSASGLSSNAADCSSAISFFELFFDEKLIDMIVEQSNKYHYTIPVKSNGSNNRKHQKPWVDIDRNEMHIFIDGIRKKIEDARLLVQRPTYRNTNVCKNYAEGSFFRCITSLTLQRQ